MTTDTGLAADRLQRIGRMLHERVERGELAGLVTRVMRHGEVVQQEAVGWQDVASRTPMRRDAIFRIASNTKPIVSVAALMLVEEGRLRLRDPINDWLPELASMRALPVPDAPLDNARTASRPITLLDLLTHKSGFTYPRDPVLRAAGALPGSGVNADTRTPLERALEEHGLDGYPRCAPDAWLARLAKLPLAHDPGTRWTYGFSTDVMGVLVGRASGLGLGGFLRDRIFAPLGMSDTGFSLDSSQLRRLATTYVNRGDGVLRPADDLGERPWGYRARAEFSTEPPFECGGAGLVSTADDLMRFQQMLLHRGKWNGVRLLSRTTVDLMTRDHMTPEQRRQPLLGFAEMWAGMGFGLGVSVVDDPTRHFCSEPAGSFGWGGLYGTSATAVPREDMVHVFMTSLHQADALSRTRQDFVTQLLASIDD